MSIGSNNHLKGIVLQELKMRKTYGTNTYQDISRNTGIKIKTVKFYAKLLVEEGKIDLSEYTPDTDMLSTKEQSTNHVTETTPTNSNDAIYSSLPARRGYIKKMLEGKLRTNKSAISSYIEFCRKNINSINLTSADFDLLGRIILSDNNLMTAENIKLGILGFVRVNKIGNARQFFEQCRTVIQSTQNSLCSAEEVDEIAESLNDYEVRVRIYAKLKKGYPIDAVFSDTVGTKIKLADLERMAKAIEADKQAQDEKGKSER